MLKRLKVAVTGALAVGSLLLLLAPPVGAASETACDKLRAISEKLGCPGSGHASCPGIANALSKAGCAQIVDTSNWHYFSSCISGSSETIALDPYTDGPAIGAIFAGTLFLDLQGSTWKMVFAGDGVFGYKFFQYGPSVAGSLVTGPGTLDCSQPKAPNGIFVDLVAYIF